MKTISQSRIPFYLFICLFCLSIISQGAFAKAVQRSALIIGNAAYQSAPLANPVNDAKDIAKALKQVGFKVTTVLDGDLRMMDKAIDTFGRNLERSGGVGLFFFAGHGVQSNGRNYLIPVGANISRETDLKYEAVDAGKVFDEIAYAQNGLNIVILDACRDNPLTRGFRSGKQGLAEMSNTPTGSLLAYSTSPGKQAADGTGRNSPYTKYLKEAIKTPGLPIELAFKQVIKKVKQETKGQQIPWVSSSLDGDFYFVPRKVANTPKAIIKPATQVASSHTVSANNLVKIELLYWEGIRQNPSIGKYKAYLSKYPKGNFVAIAKDELARAQKQRKLNATAELKPIAPSKQINKKAQDLVLKDCDYLLKNYQLSIGKQNAYQCYTDLLSRNPNDKYAKSGISKVENTYVELIKRAQNNNQIKKAQTYLGRLERLNPEHENLAALKQTMLQLTQKPAQKKAAEQQAAIAAIDPTKVNRTLPESIESDKRDVFYEFAEVIESFMADNKMDASEVRKTKKYLPKIAKIAPNSEYYHYLKTRFEQLSQEKLEIKTEAVKRVQLTEEDQQVFDEFLETIVEMLEEPDLSDKQVAKLKKYFSRLESISPQAPQLKELKNKYGQIFN